MSQPGLQTIAIHMLLNIPQSKDKQTMELGQFTEYNKRNIFLQNLCARGKEARRLVPDLFLFFKKA